MEQMRVENTTKKFTVIALILQCVYLISILVITLMPQLYLWLFGSLGDGEGLSFNRVYLICAVINTAVFILLCAVFYYKIKSRQRIGIGYGVLLGVYSYVSHFIVDGLITRYLYTYWVANLCSQTSSLGLHSSSATVSEIIEGTSVVSSCCSAAKVWFFAAMILMFVAYALYRFYCKNTMEQS